jgi:hypothetical protein
MDNAYKLYPLCFLNHKGNRIISIVKNYSWNKLHYLQSFNTRNLMQIDDVSKVFLHV